MIHDLSGHMAIARPKIEWRKHPHLPMTHGLVGDAIVARITRTMCGINPYVLHYKKADRWEALYDNRMVGVKIRFEIAMNQTPQ